jgi:hypothetical protein
MGEWALVGRPGQLYPSQFVCVSKDNEPLCALPTSERVSVSLTRLFAVADGKFHLLPTGELLVHNLEFSDQFPSFRCRTMHRLSRQVVVSSPANVRITGQQSPVNPICMNFVEAPSWRPQDGRGLSIVVWAA